MQPFKTISETFEINKVGFIEKKPLLDPLVPSLKEASSAEEAFPTYGDSETDIFLSFLWSQGWIDENGKITSKKLVDLILPPLDEAEIEEISHLLNKPFKIQFLVTEDIKKKIKKTLTSKRNIEAYKKNNKLEELLEFTKMVESSINETTSYECEIYLKDFFFHILNKKGEYSLENTPENALKIVGGFGRRLLYHWMRKVLLTNGIKNIKQFSPALHLSSLIPDIDFRSLLINADYDTVRNLAEQQLDYFTDLICKDEKMRELYRYMLEQASAKNASLFEGERYWAKTTFGNSCKEQFDWVIAHKQIRSHLFSIDALSIPIWPLVNALITENYAPTIIPESDSLELCFQSVIDNIGKVLHIDHPETINSNGWARLVTLLSLRYVSREKDNLSIITHNVLQGIKEKNKIADKIVHFLMTSHENHYKGDSYAFLAITFNAQEILTKELSSRLKNEIFRKMIIYFEENFLDKISSGHPYEVLIHSIKTSGLSWEPISIILQALGFLKIASEKNKKDQYPVYLTKHDGAPALQFVSDQYSFLIQWNPLENFHKLFNLEENDLNAIKNLSFFFPSLPYGTNGSSQLERNFQSLFLDFSSLEKVAEKLLNHESPPLNSLGFHLLLIAYFHKKNPESLKLLIEKFPFILTLEKNDHNQKLLVLNLENAIKSSEFASLSESRSFMGINNLIKNKQLTKEAIYFEWYMGLILSNESKLDSLNHRILREYLPDHLESLCSFLLTKRTIDLVTVANKLIKHRGLSEKQLEFLMMNLIKDSPASTHHLLKKMIDKHRLMPMILQTSSKKSFESKSCSYLEKICIFLSHLNLKTSELKNPFEIFSKIINDKGEKSVLEYHLLAQILDQLKHFKFTSSSKSSRRKKSQINIEKEVSEIIINCLDKNITLDDKQLLSWLTNENFLKKGSQLSVLTWIKSIQYLLDTSSNSIDFIVDTWNKADQSGVWKSHQFLEGRYALIISICEKLLTQQDKRIHTFLQLISNIELSDKLKFRGNELITKLLNEEKGNSSHLNQTYYSLLSPEQQLIEYSQLIHEEINKSNFLKAFEYISQLVKIPTDDKHSVFFIIHSFFNELLKPYSNSKIGEENLLIFKNCFNSSGLKKWLDSYSDLKIDLILQAFANWKRISHLPYHHFTYFIIQQIMQTESIDNLEENTLSQILYELTAIIQNESLVIKNFPKGFQKVVSLDFPRHLKTFAKKELFDALYSLLIELSLRSQLPVFSDDHKILILNISNFLLNKSHVNFLSIQKVHNLLNMLKFYNYSLFIENQVDTYKNLIHILFRPPYFENPECLNYLEIWIPRILSLNGELIQTQDLITWFNNLIHIKNFKLISLLSLHLLKRNTDEKMITESTKELFENLSSFSFEKKSEILLSIKEFLLRFHEVNVKNWIRLILSKLIKTESTIEEGNLVFSLLNNFQINQNVPWDYLTHLIITYKDKPFIQKTLNLFNQLDHLEFKNPLCSKEYLFLLGQSLIYCKSIEKFHHACLNLNNLLSNDKRKKTDKIPAIFVKVIKIFIQIGLKFFTTHERNESLDFVLDFIRFKHLLCKNSLEVIKLIKLISQSNKIDILFETYKILLILENEMDESEFHHLEEKKVNNLFLFLDKLKEKLSLIFGEFPDKTFENSTQKRKYLESKLNEFISLKELSPEGVLSNGDLFLNNLEIYPNNSKEKEKNVRIIFEKSVVHWSKNKRPDNLYFETEKMIKKLTNPHFDLEPTNTSNNASCYVEDSFSKLIKWKKIQESNDDISSITSLPKFLSEIDKQNYLKYNLILIETLLNFFDYSTPTFISKMIFYKLNILINTFPNNFNLIIPLIRKYIFSPTFAKDHQLFLVHTTFSKKLFLIAFENEKNMEQESKSFHQISFFLHSEIVILNFKDQLHLKYLDKLLKKLLKSRNSHHFVKACKILTTITADDFLSMDSFELFFNYWKKILFKTLPQPFFQLEDINHLQDKISAKEFPEVSMIEGFPKLMITIFEKDIHKLFIKIFTHLNSFFQIYTQDNQFQEATKSLLLFLINSQPFFEKNYVCFYRFIDMVINLINKLPEESHTEGLLKKLYLFGLIFNSNLLFNENEKIDRVNCFKKLLKELLQLKTPLAKEYTQSLFYDAIKAGIIFKGFPHILKEISIMIKLA